MSVFHRAGAGSGPGPSVEAPDPVRALGEPARSRPPGVERVVLFRPRSVVLALGALLGLLAVARFLFLARWGLTLIAIALFLAVALNPAVESFQRRGLRRGWAVAAVSTLGMAVLILIGLVLIPPLVLQTTNLIHALPGLVSDLSKGHGPLGFLERRYSIVERVRTASTGQGFTDLLTGAAQPGLGVVMKVATTVIGAVIIAFLTLFMLLEGPAWRQRVIEVVPPHNRKAVERIGAGVYRAVGGFVTGDLLASLLAGLVAAAVLLATGTPYAIPLAVFVVIVDLVPYLGPVVATLLLTAVAFSRGAVPALVVFLVLLGYHLIEGHSLRPLIYGRVLRLSPLAVLIAILLATEVAGIVGAVLAIPIAGAIRVVVAELLDRRRGGSVELPH